MSGIIGQLQAATHRVVDHLAGSLRALELTPGELNALAQMRPERPLSVAELQAATGQRPSTVTGVIDRLERRGLIRREVNPRDRRSFVLQLTAEGERAAGEVHRAFDALEERVLAHVGPRSVAGFLRVVEAFDDVAGGGAATRGGGAATRGGAAATREGGAR